MAFGTRRIHPGTPINGKDSTFMPFEIYTDGGSRGNPGPAAAAVVIRDENGQAVLEAGYFLGRATNNVAEYTALVMALEAANKGAITDIRIHMDSELIVRQITGEYRVKDATLAVLFEQAQRLLLKFDSWTIQHVRREQNRQADALVNKALDAQADVVFSQVGNTCPDARPAAQPQATGQTPSRQEGAGARKTPASSPSAGDSGEVFAVRVRCISQPKQDACRAGMDRDMEFLFTDATPPGLCLHATKAVLDTVLAMQYSASQGSELAPVRVRCRRPGCGAEFEVRIQRDQ